MIGTSRRVDDIEALRRLTMALNVSSVLALVSDLISEEADYCLLRGEADKAAVLARRARWLAHTAQEVGRRENTTA